jgi:multidrug resistance efflux pump
MGLFGKKVVQDAARFMDQIQRHPVVRSIARETERQDYERRTEIVATIERQRVAQPALIAPFDDKVKRATAAVAEQRSALASAEAELLSASMDRVQIVFQTDHQIETLEVELIRTADPRFDQVVVEMAELHDATRRFVSFSTRAGDRYISGRHNEETVTNAGAASRKLAAIREAQSRALGMKAEAVSDIDGALKGLRATVDAINVHELTTVVRSTARA